MKIVCVDDDAITLKYFKEAIGRLELPGVEAVMLESGKAAVETVAATPVDLVILDNKLPDMPGLDVLRAIVKISPRTEVLMVTGYSSVETAVEAMKAGARDYIEKPVRLALLQEKIRNIVELQQREHEAEDFRFAKEMMEAGAQREVTSLEELIGAMKRCQECVLEIIDSGRGDAEKIIMIREEIAGFRKTCC